VQNAQLQCLAHRLLARAHSQPGADALDHDGEAVGGTLALRPEEGLVVELA
jgi:hypothetical protein